jgi:hypothetical protein
MIFNKLSLLKMNEVSEELKNKIRRERILIIVENHNNKIHWYGREFYNSRPKPVFFKYQCPPQYSLKDVTEDDVEEWKNERIKDECVIFLNSIPDFKVEEGLYKRFKDMDVNDVLIETYKLFLRYQIKRIAEPVSEDAFNNMSLDNLENMVDKLIIRTEKEKKKDEIDNDKGNDVRKDSKKKAWWNLF